MNQINQNMNEIAQPGFMSLLGDNFQSTDEVIPNSNLFLNSSPIQQTNQSFGDLMNGITVKKGVEKSSGKELPPITLSQSEVKELQASIKANKEKAIQTKAEKIKVFKPAASKSEGGFWGFLKKLCSFFKAIVPLIALIPVVGPAISAGLSTLATVGEKIAEDEMK